MLYHSILFETTDRRVELTSRARFSVTLVSSMIGICSCSKSEGELVQLVANAKAAVIRRHWPEEKFSCYHGTPIMNNAAMANIKPIAANNRMLLM